LTRIEKIASEGLGMKRPEKIEFIAMLPARINTNSVVAEQSSNEAEERTYLQAGNFPREFANLPIFKNQ
jgi:hypothetical protein